MNFLGEAKKYIKNGGFGALLYWWRISRRNREGRTEKTTIILSKLFSKYYNKGFEDAKELYTNNQLKFKNELLQIFILRNYTTERFNPLYLGFSYHKTNYI